MKNLISITTIALLMTGMAFAQVTYPLVNDFDVDEEGWLYSNEIIDGQDDDYWGVTDENSPESGKHLRVPLYIEFDFDQPDEEEPGEEPLSPNDNYIYRNDIANPGILTFFAKYQNQAEMQEQLEESGDNIINIPTPPEFIESVTLKVYYNNMLIGSEDISTTYPQSPYSFTINHPTGSSVNELKILADITYSEQILGQDGDVHNFDNGAFIENLGNVFIDNLNLTEFDQDESCFVIVSSDKYLGDVTISPGVDLETIPGFRYIPVTDVFDVSITGDNSNLNACVRIYCDTEYDLSSLVFFRSEDGNPPWERLWPTSSGSEGNKNYVEVCGVEHLSQWVLGGPDPNAKAPLSNWMFILIFGVIGIVVLIRYKF